MKNILIAILLCGPLLTNAQETNNLVDKPLISQDQKRGDSNKNKVIHYLQEHLSRENINRQLLDAFNSLKIDLDTDIFKVKISDGLSIKGNYAYEVEKSYIQNQYTRRDTYDLKIDHDPKRSFFPNLQTPVFLKANRDNKVIISRQYDKKIDAMKALPFNIARLPIRAKNVERLDKGDFISIPASMAVTTGFSYSDIAPVLNTGVTGFFTMAGEFLIQVYKLEEQKVRVKIIAEKKKTTGLSFKSRFGVELFSFELLGFDIEPEYKIEWIKFDSSKTKGNIILADYIFHLEHKESRTLYNKLFNNVFKFKEAKLLAESLNSDLLDRYYVVNLEDVDRIARADGLKTNPRIERVFKGNNRYTSKTTGLKLDLKLFELTTRSHLINNKFIFEKLNGENITFHYPSYTKRTKNKLTLKIFNTNEEKILSYYGLTSPHNDHKFLNTGVTFNRRDNDFGKFEQRRFKNILGGLLPLKYRDEVLAKIPEIKRYINFNGNITMIFKKEAFEEFDKYSLEDFTSVISEHLRDKKFFRKSIRNKDDHRNPWYLSDDEYNRKAKRLAKQLYKIIKSELPYNEKLEVFMKKLKSLSKEYYILQVLTMLLPQDQLEDYLYLDLYIADDSETLVDMTIGTNEYSEVYKQLEYLNRYIRGHGEDLRIEEQVGKIEEIQKID